ncbi:hypothetical protein D9M69_515620 [compost metagenome]
MSEKRGTALAGLSDLIKTSTARPGRVVIGDDELLQRPAAPPPVQVSPAPTPAPAPAAPPPVVSQEAPPPVAPPVAPRPASRRALAAKPVFVPEGDPRVIKQFQLRFPESLKHKLDFVCEHQLHTKPHPWIMRLIEDALDEELAAYEASRQS